MSSRLEKLLSIRARIIGDLEHHIAEVEKFDANSSVALITFRSVVLEKSHNEFIEIGKELEKVSTFHELGILPTIVAKNRVCQDKYLEIKSQILLLLQNEKTARLQAPFSDTSHRSCSKLSDRQNAPNQSCGLGLKPPHKPLVTTSQLVFEPIKSIEQLVRPMISVSNKQSPTTSSPQTVNVQNKNDRAYHHDDSFTLHSRSENWDVCVDIHKIHITNCLDKQNIRDCSNHNHTLIHGAVKKGQSFYISETEQNFQFNQSYVCNREHTAQLNQSRHQSIRDTPMLSTKNSRASTSQVKSTFFIGSMYENMLTFPMTQQIKLKWLTFVVNSHKKSAHITMMSAAKETRHWCVVTTDKLFIQKRAIWEIEEQFARNPQIKIGYSKQIQALPINRANHVMPLRTGIEIRSITAIHRPIYNPYAKTSKRHSLNDLSYIGPTILVNLIQCRLDKTSFIANRKYQQLWVNNVYKYSIIKMYPIAQFKGSNSSCLGLCRAALAKPIHATNKDMAILCVKIHEWIDSSMTSIYLSALKCQMKSFAGLHMIEIREKIPVEKGRNTRTNDNPVDFATQTRVDLFVSHQRWSGPSFLLEQPVGLENWSQIPKGIISRKLTPAIKIKTINIQVNHSKTENLLLESHPSVNSLLKITDTSYRVSTAKVNKAKKGWTQNKQERCYPIEISFIKCSLLRKHGTLTLKPIFDEQNIFGSMTVLDTRYFQPRIRHLHRHRNAPMKHSLVKIIRYVRQNSWTKVIRQFKYVRKKTTDHTFTA